MNVRSVASWLVFLVPLFAPSTASALAATYVDEQPVWNFGPSISGDRIAYVFYEGYRGQDRNHDGDAQDIRVAYYDIPSRATTLLEDQPLWGVGPALAGDILAYATYEGYLGRDLNGDGDTSDILAAYHDIAAGRTAYVNERPLSFGPRGDGGKGIDNSGERLVFMAWEGNLGVDRNGDGDADDVLLAFYDIPTRSLRYVDAHPLFDSTPAIEGDLIAYAAYEGYDGVDRNGDRDAVDFLLAVYDIGSGNTTFVDRRPLTHEWNIELDGGVVAFTAYEGDDGTDRNGDGDAGDWILATYDVGSGRLSFIDESPVFRCCPSISGDILAYATWEGYEGEDRNGDGSADDILLAYYNLSTGEQVTIDERPNTISFKVDVSGARIAFGAYEGYDGVDRNGDGDASDSLLAFYTLEEAGTDVSLPPASGTAAERANENSAAASGISPSLQAQSSAGANAAFKR